MTELGGTVDVGPFDASGVGRMAMVSDCNGRHFSIIALANEAV